MIRKPEVIRIARALKCDTMRAAACCMVVWEWAEDATIDGLVAGLSVVDVSTAAGIPGVGEAMKAAGWIVESDGGVQFPNWDRHNAEPAKARALDALRKRVTRKEDKTRTLAGRMSG